MHTAKTPRQHAPSTTATTFAHLDAMTVLSCSIAELGIYPAADPLDSKAHMLDPHIVGQEHYEVWLCDVVVDPTPARTHARCGMTTTTSVAVDPSTSTSAGTWRATAIRQRRSGMGSQCHGGTVMTTTVMTATTMTRWHRWPVPRRRQQGGWPVPGDDGR